MAFVSPISTGTRFVQRQLSTTCQSTRQVGTASRVNNRQARIHTISMGIGEDGLEEDLQFAQGCIDEGCSVESVQDVLTRLERRRAVLSLEVDKIEQIMAVLAKENLGGDRSLIADAMAAAVSIFAKTDDDYPNVGSEAINAWTLDPLKKQPKL